MEEWRTIPGIEGYEASNLGRIRSVDRLVKGRANQKPWFKAGSLLNPFVANERGYLRVKAGGRLHYVQRLVLMAFVGPCPEGLEACHADGDPTNNALSNLRWDTRKENAADRTLHGNTKRGVDHARSKLTEEAVRIIRSSDEPYRLLAKRFGITEPYVGDVKRGQGWAHVS